MPVICLPYSGERQRKPPVWYNGGMKVKVKLFASLRTFGPDEQIIELADRTSIDAVVDILKIPRTIRLLKIVNGEHRPADHVLQDGDDLALFPPIAGG
jgi:molybdopterin converting factor small subunit